MKPKKEICPNCGKKAVEYQFTSDRWECENCGDIDLYSPKDREKYSSY